MKNTKLSSGHCVELGRKDVDRIVSAIVKIHNSDNGRRLEKAMVDLSFGQNLSKEDKALLKKAGLLEKYKLGDIESILKCMCDCDEEGAFVRLENPYPAAEGDNPHQLISQKDIGHTKTDAFSCLENLKTGGASDPKSLIETLKKLAKELNTSPAELYFKDPMLNARQVDERFEDLRKLWHLESAKIRAKAIFKEENSVSKLLSALKEIPKDLAESGRDYMALTEDKALNIKAKTSDEVREKLEVHCARRAIKPLFEEYMRELVDPKSQRTIDGILPYIEDKLKEGQNISLGEINPSGSVRGKIIPKAKARINERHARLAALDAA